MDRWVICTLQQAPEMRLDIECLVPEEVQLDVVCHVEILRVTRRGRQLVIATVLLLMLLLLFVALILPLVVITLL